MKSLKLPILSLGILLAMASCKKNDLQESAAPDTIETMQTTAGESDWQSVSAWHETKQESFSVLHANISDQQISEDVAGSGLVLVYKMNGTDVKSLPAEEKQGTGSRYWYYQVTAGNLMITIDNYGQDAPTGDSFKYFVVTPDQLKNLEGQGYTRSKLMQLSFDEASSLL